MAAKRFRLQVMFWLNLNKPDEAEIADKIEVLKNERTFAKTLRDGIRLICDLRDGRIDVLRELFPFVFDMVATVLETERAQLEAERLRPIADQLQRMETILLQQGNVPIAAPAPAPAPTTSGPKMLSVNKAATPTFDDDDDEILDIRKSTSTTGVDNFFRTLNLLQQ